MTHIDQALKDARAILDPYARIKQADQLDEALATARSVVAKIKRDAINSLRTPTTGYGSIATKLGLTKTRVQQIANIPTKTIPVAFAIQDEHGQWHGNPALVTEYAQLTAAYPFAPADQFNPLAGHTFTVRCAALADDEDLSLNALHLRNNDGGITPARMTHAVYTALFGPTETGTPEYTRWTKAQDAKRRELGGD
jgi:hypothetical protein